MARIYKESRYVLQLLIGKSYVAQYDDVKISFYTKNPNNQVMVDNGITIKRNIAEVKIESTLFDNLEEGLISYIVYGTKDGIPFIEERQSNYFLKAPLVFKPGEGGSCNLENKSVTPSMGERNNDGYIVVEEDEVYDGLSRVVIDPQTLYNEGINEQKSKLESISITENGVYSKEDGYNHIEVNVPPKINIQEAGINFAYSTFTEVPEWADFNGVTNMERMFYSCKNLQTIPLLNTSNVTDMSYMFTDCFNLQAIPLFDTSNVTDMKFMLGTCNSLQTIPEIDTSIVVNMSFMFYDCDNLQTIPLLDTSKVSNANDMFHYCRSLKTLPNNFNFGICTNLSDMFYSAGLTDYSFLETWVINPNANMDEMIDNTNTTYVPAIPCVGNSNYQQSAIFWAYGDFSKLTYFGGWIGRKYNVDRDYILKKMPNLSYESCISILNNLYDFTGNGETPNSNQGKLKVHPNFLTTVGEDISIGTNKGWTITA